MKIVLLDTKFEMKQLTQITHRLIINGTSTEQPGLYYGKTGIAVFFFHYARKTGNELFQDYAIDLISEIMKQITDTYPARYDTGLAGIGAGFEYFLQNGFIETDDDDFFEDFDTRMYRAAMYEPYPNLNLEAGLTGWGRYFISRLLGNGYKNSKLHKALIHIANEISKKVFENTIPESEQSDVYRFLHDLTKLPGYAEKYSKSMQQCVIWKCINKPDIQNIFPYMDNLKRLYICQNYFNIDLTQEIAQEWEKWKKSDNSLLTDIGLLNGWTAEGMLNLTSFHAHNVSWIKLL